MTETEKPSGWWWLSFADATRPEGEQFLGAAVVKGSDIVSAALVAKIMGCNPGGEVKGIAILEGRVPGRPWRDRLLSKPEAEHLRDWAIERWGTGA